MKKKSETVIFQELIFKSSFSFLNKMPLFCYTYKKKLEMVAVNIKAQISTCE